MSEMPEVIGAFDLYGTQTHGVWDDETHDDWHTYIKKSIVTPEAAKQAEHWIEAMSDAFFPTVQIKETIRTLLKAHGGKDE